MIYFNSTLVIETKKSIFLLYFWLDPKVPSASRRTRLDKNFWFSTGRIVHAIQAAPTHWPALASVSLTKGQRQNPSLENLRNFYQATDSKCLAVGFNSHMSLQL
jgi:hypothetical protein